MKVPDGVLSRRLQILQQKMVDVDLDCVFLWGGGPDLHYILGVPSEPPYDDTGRYWDWLYGAFISPNNDPLVLAPRMGGARRAGAALHGTPWGNCIRVVGDGIRSSFEEPRTVIAETLSALGKPRNIGITEDLWAKRLLSLQSADPSVQIRDATPLLMSMRMIKDEVEIEFLRSAAAIAERAFAAVLPNLHVGVTEWEIANELDRLMVVFGGDGPSFPSGVKISGPGIKERPVAGRSNGDTPVQPGAAMAFDLGCSVGGYLSDFGRTVFWGDPNRDMLYHLDIVMQSRKEAIDAVVPGRSTGADVCVAARRPVEAAGLAEGVKSWVGHGVGLVIHEAPVFFPGEQTVMEVGMCFALEPHLTLPGRAGVRCEDMLLVTELGVEDLNQFSRDPIVLG